MAEAADLLRNMHMLRRMQIAHGTILEAQMPQPYLSVLKRAFCTSHRAWRTAVHFTITAIIPRPASFWESTSPILGCATGPSMAIAAQMSATAPVYITQLYMPIPCCQCIMLMSMDMGLRAGTSLSKCEQPHCRMGARRLSISPRLHF